MEETLNRTDYSALDNIQDILKVFNKTSWELTIEDYKWVVDMITHEVNQTHRTV